MAGFFKKLFKFGKKTREEEESEAPVQEVADATSDTALAPDEGLPVAHAEAAGNALADSEAGAALDDTPGITPLDEMAEARARAEAEAEEAERAARAAMEEEAARAREAAQAARKEAERKEREEAEKRRAEDEAARLAEEKAAQEKADAEAKAKKDAEEKAAKAEAERLETEKAEAARREAEEKAARQKEADEAAQAAREKAAREKAEKEEAERLAREKAEKEEADRLAAEQAERENEERIAAEAADEARRAAEAEAEEANTAMDGVFDAPGETHHEHAEETPEPLSDTPEPSPAPADEAPKKKSWFSRLRDGLSRSSNQLTENISSVFTKRKLDEGTLQELEDILIQADLGVETAMNITDKLATQRMGKDITDEEVRTFMAAEIEKVLTPVAAELELDLEHQPHVILVVGVNGSGKTTTIGKLSQKLYDAGFSTLLVAGDTFRAAAIEQLTIWGSRTNSTVVSRPLGSDAAGVAYDAYDLAKEQGRDVMLMDTAGRLQNKKELMDELEKIIRVLKKQDPTAPHTVLLTLDATTGQNALQQVEIFKDVAGVNGLVMTKLDGTARGGILVAISSKYGLPVYFLGVGEQVDDLEPFEARDFARSIAGLDRA